MDFIPTCLLSAKFKGAELHVNCLDLQPANFKIKLDFLCAAKPSV